MEKPPRRRTKNPARIQRDRSFSAGGGGRSGITGAGEFDRPSPQRGKPCGAGQRLAAERTFLLTLDGSCETPIAGLAELDGDTLRLRGEVLRPDGSQSLAGERSGAIADGADMGHDLAQELLSRAGPDFFDWH